MEINQGLRFNNLCIFPIQYMIGPNKCLLKEKKKLYNKTFLMSK